METVLATCEEISGRAANTPVEEAERMHLMAEADLNPDDKIRLEDAEEMLEELGVVFLVNRDGLMNFIQDGNTDDE
eukprot:symbB.v1.2.000879.t2/scaffold38.1/size396883/19